MILTPGFLLMFQNAEIPIPGDDWEDVTVIPRDQREWELFTKHLNCSDGLEPIYALHSVKKKTILGCGENVIVYVKDYCIEYNTQGLQVKYDAPRMSNITGHTSFNINASKGYLLWDCFETYGGVPSPKEREKDINRFKSENAQQNQTIRALQEKITEITRESAEQKRLTNIFISLFTVAVLFILVFLIAFFVFRKLGFIQFDITFKTKSKDTPESCTDRCNDQFNSQDELLNNVGQRNEGANLHLLTCTLLGTQDVPDTLSRNGGTTPC